MPATLFVRQQHQQEGPSTGNQERNPLSQARRSFSCQARLYLPYCRLPVFVSLKNRRVCNIVPGMRLHGRKANTAILTHESNKILTSPPRYLFCSLLHATYTCHVLTRPAKKRANGRAPRTEGEATRPRRKTRRRFRLRRRRRSRTLRVAAGRR